MQPSQGISNDDGMTLHMAFLPFSSMILPLEPPFIQCGAPKGSLSCFINPRTMIGHTLTIVLLGGFHHGIYIWKAPQGLGYLLPDDLLVVHFLTQKTQVCIAIVLFGKGS